DVEAEREVLAQRLQVAQEALQGVAGVDGVGAVAGPQNFHRLARLAHGEGVLRAEAQLGLQVRHLVPLRELLERHGRAAHEGGSARRSGTKISFTSMSLLPVPTMPIAYQVSMIR